MDKRKERIGRGGSVGGSGVCAGIEMIAGLGLVATITPVTHAKLSAEDPQHETKQKKKEARGRCVTPGSRRKQERQQQQVARCSTAFRHPREPW